MIKPELKGSKIFIKSLNIDLDVIDENIELLKKVKAPVFIELVEFKGIEEPKKNDNNKSRKFKRSVSDS